MTNREWLQTLSDEEFEKITWLSCKCCIYGGTECGELPCAIGRAEWLQAEHKEESDAQ